MKLTRAIVIIICSQFLVNFAVSQEKYTEVSISLAAPGAKQFIFDKLNADHFNYDRNNARVVLNSDELAELQRSPYIYTILIDDVVHHTTALNRRITPEESRVPFQSGNCLSVNNIINTPASFGTGGSLRLGAAVGNPGYYTYAEMIAAMQALAVAYPTIVNIYSIGHSANGTAIYGIKISDNASVDEHEPEVLYTGLQHAREAIGGTSLIFFMQYLAENYASDNRIKELVDNREIFIIPCVNPDGYAYNYSGASASYPFTGGGLWRKNRRNTGGGASNIGVDLNRNYSVDWGNCSGAGSSCGSNVKTSDTYYGPNAFSEPETQAIRDFVYARKFVNAIDQHCYGSYYSLPYGRPTLHAPLNFADSTYYTRIPALMGLYNGHRAGNSPQTVNYEVAGGIKDWLLMGDIGTGSGPKGKVLGMTGEAGGGNFWAPVNQILQLCKENCFQNLQMAYAAGDYYMLEDKSDMAVTHQNGHFSFSIRRIGLGNNPVTVSLIPIDNLQSVGTPVSTTLANYYDTYTDSISYCVPPTFVYGQKIRLVWKIESDGITTYDTIVKLYNPLTLLYDNMEGSFSTNWTATISPAGPAGWAFTNSQSYQGNASMTESPTGNYTTSSTRIVTYKNTFDLGDATEAYLSFWTKYRAENFHDKLQVQLATNGTNWTPICGSNTIPENNTTSGGFLNNQPALTGIMDTWTKVVYNLKDYIGNGTVSLRLHFSSDNDAGNFAFEIDDGFYIDNLKLVKVTNSIVVPVKFGNIKGQLLPDKTIQVDWEAYTDVQHDYFDVEKSSIPNGPFQTFERFNGPPPYKAIDDKPVAGFNYYRIRQVDQNGTFTYSPVVKVNNAINAMPGAIYPNPADKAINIRYRQVTTPESLLCSISDFAGRVVFEQTVMVSPGQSDIRLSVGHLRPQLYRLTVRKGHAEIVMSENFIKK